MAYREHLDARTAVALQENVDHLRAQLAERDKTIASMLQAESDKATAAARDAAAAEQTAARAKVLEASRKKAWTLHRFNTFADEHPDQRPPLDSIFSDPPADGSWPPNDGPENWNVPALVNSAQAEVAEAGASGTRLHSLLDDLRKRHARTSQA